MKKRIQELKKRRETIKQKIKDIRTDLFMFNSGLENTEKEIFELEIEDIKNTYEIKKGISLRELNNNPEPLMNPTIPYERLVSFIPNYMGVDELTEDVLRDFSKLYEQEVEKGRKSWFENWKLMIDYWEGRCDGVDRRKVKTKN